MPDPDPWYRFHVSEILRTGSKSVITLVQNLMFTWCNRMEDTSQSNEVEHTSATTSNNTEGTGNTSQSNQMDHTFTSTSNNTERTGYVTSQSNEVDHSSAFTSNNTEATGDISQSDEIGHTSASSSNNNNNEGPGDVSQSNDNEGTGDISQLDNIDRTPASTSNNNNGGTGAVFQSDENGGTGDILQSEEMDHTSASTSNNNNNEKTGDISQSDNIDRTSASTSNNNEGTGDVSQSDDNEGTGITSQSENIDRTAASTSNNTEGTASRDSEHDFAPAREVLKELCSKPYNEAWMNDMDKRFLKPFKDGQTKPCRVLWLMLFEYEAVQVNDELAFKILSSGDIGVPGEEVEHFARVSQVILRLLAFHGVFLTRGLYYRSLDSTLIHALCFSKRAGATQ
ncbi:MAG: hypothetical protein Q9207_001456 [Kuettlingeria erythrocarpa]